MKLKNVLIAVNDVEQSRQFYSDLFGLDLVLDNDGNMILTDGLVLQDKKIWKKCLGKDIILVTLLKLSRIRLKHQDQKVRHLICS